MGHLLTAEKKTLIAWKRQQKHPSEWRVGYPPAGEWVRGGFNISTSGRSSYMRH